ncbi:hypothetical protein ACRAKI_14465 [Saccharothrix isguenensis]
MRLVATGVEFVASRAIVVLDAGVLLAVGRDLRAVVPTEVPEVDDTSRFHSGLRLEGAVREVTVVERWRGAPLICSRTM